MRPSTNHPESEHQFAADVLQKLLRHIAIENVNNSNYPQLGNHVYRVTHAWTDGPLMYLVYETPPRSIAWGLVRDTRQSLIDPGPWNEADNPALYYYLLDLEEGWSGPLSPDPGDDPEVIHWRGDQSEGLPERLSDIPDSYRHTPPAVSAEETRQEPPPVTEPRRYADPNGPLPPDVHPSFP